MVPKVPGQVDHYCRALIRTATAEGAAPSCTPVGAPPTRGLSLRAPHLGRPRSSFVGELKEISDTL